MYYREASNLPTLTEINCYSSGDLKDSFFNGKQINTWDHLKLDKMSVYSLCMMYWHHENPACQSNDDMKPSLRLFNVRLQVLLSAIDLHCASQQTGMNVMTSLQMEAVLSNCKFCSLLSFLYMFLHIETTTLSVFPKP